ncbi:MAG TPA: hypothetical protein VMY76_00610 [Gemmatimonadales bacterium]|nr:hypothetical protein [Gemmatimonadales bacterium]
MTALSLALALWGLLAFAGWWMWLRAQAPKAGPLEARVEAVSAHLLREVEARQGMGDALRREATAAEDRRRKLSKRVGDLEFRHLGKRMTPPEDEA